MGNKFSEVDHSVLVGKRLIHFNPTFKYIIPYIGTSGTVKKKCIHPKVYLETDDGEVYMICFKNRENFFINGEYAFNVVSRRVYKLKEGTTYITKEIDRRSAVYKEGYKIQPFEIKSIDKSINDGLINYKIVDTRENTYEIYGVKEFKRKRI
jgi:hypothetical protein